MSKEHILGLAQSGSASASSRHNKESGQGVLSVATIVTGASLQVNVTMNRHKHVLAAQNC